jgi:RNA polymerase sigma-70 factor, ECF subfamily
VGHAVLSSRLDTASDTELVRLSANGDQRAFRLLLGRHLTAVLATARRILNDESEAEDVAQEATVRLWTLAGTLVVPDYGVRPWLKRVATNLALDRLRARRRVDVTDQVPETPEPPAQGRALDAANRKLAVGQALANLPERQRLAVTLFHFEGLSQSEVGAALAISDDAVESLLARGRRALKLALKDDWRALLPDDEHEG